MAARPAEAGVISTNGDATMCKRCAVDLGYWKDPFLKPFCQGMSKQRRSPLINRGYYARVTAVWQLALRFLSVAGDRAQIVSLGAGYDTLFWRLMSHGALLSAYYEVDYPEVVQMKGMTSKHSRVLALPEASASKLHLIPGDLRNPAGLVESLAAEGMDSSLPTLVLTECVMVYLNGHDSAQLVKAVGGALDTAIWVNYEQVNPDDAYGQMMLHNLKQRDCPLLGLAACPTLDAQRERFLSNGWDSAHALDMNEVYARLPQDDVKRVERIEPLDEFEEWRLINEHYCISSAFKGTVGPGSVDLSAVAL